MSQKRKKGIVGIVLAVLAIALIVFGVTQLHNNQKASDNSVAYIEESDEKQSSEQKSEEKTQGDIDAEEDIDAEQIVAKIMADGYVTAHGDHFHYYSGKIPADAIFSEEMLVDETYTFNPDDVEYEVDNGSIVKVGDDYALYLEDSSNRENIRTVEEIKAQREAYTSDTND